MFLCVCVCLFFVRMFLAPSFVRPRKGIMSRENGNFIVIYFERNEELCVLVCACVCFSGEREEGWILLSGMER